VRVGAGRGTGVGSFSQCTRCAQGYFSGDELSGWLWKRHEHRRSRQLGRPSAQGPARRRKRHGRWHWRRHESRRWERHRRRLILSMHEMSTRLLPLEMSSVVGTGSGTNTGAGGSSAVGTGSDGSRGQHRHDRRRRK